MELRPKAWALLRYLAERPGALVTKEELHAAVWGEIVVSDDTLTQTLGELRRALRDDPRAPHVIETVHRRGVRFIARVHTTPPGDGGLDVGGRTAARPGRGTPRDPGRTRHRARNAPGHLPERVRRRAPGGVHAGRARHRQDRDRRGLPAHAAGVGRRRPDRIWPVRGAARRAGALHAGPGGPGAAEPRTGSRPAALHPARRRPELAGADALASLARRRGAARARGHRHDAPPHAA